ncbi:MAG: BREX-3 system P-loop-containing protein BrxF [Roseiflexaceae bacterium]
MQITQLQLALDRFQAARPYYPCCLLVHPDVRQLQKVAEHVVAWYRWPVLSIGTTLSAALLTVAPGRRSRETHAMLAAATQRFAPGPVLCADIDLLFEPSLALDPLRLLRDSSRIAMLIVLWPGTIAAGILAYAAPAHAHYRAWNRTDLSADSIIPV